MRHFRGFEVRDAIDHTIRRARSLWRPNDSDWNPVVFSGSGAYTDGRIINLPNFVDDALIPHDEFRRLQAFALHEIGHVIYSKFDAFQGETFFKRMHNAVEDIWMENEVVKSGLIPGANALFQELAEYCLNEGPVDWSLPGNIAFALVNYGRGLRGDWNPALNPIFAQAMPMIERSSGTHENAKIAQWIIDQLRSQADSPSDGQSGDSSDQSGDSSDQSSDSGDQSGDSGDQSSDSGDQSSDSGDQSDQTTDQTSDQTTDQTSDQTGGEPSGQPGDKPGDPGDKPGDKPGKLPIPGNDEVVEGKPIEPSFKPEAGSCASGMRDDSESLPNSFFTESNHWPIVNTANGRLRYDVRRLLEKSDHYGWQAGYRSGAINPNRLGLYRTSTNVFKRRFEEEGIDSSVVILIDCSGSMNKRPVALVNAVAAVGDALAAANVPFAIVCFRGTKSVVKSFGEPWKRFLGNLKNLMLMGVTRDIDAIALAQKLLRSRSESRRLVFAITDGCGTDAAGAAAQVKTGVRMGIDMIGVGIGYDVSRVYGPNCVRVDSVDDLSMVALNQIKLAA